MKDRALAFNSEGYTILPTFLSEYRMMSLVEDAYIIRDKGEFSDFTPIMNPHRSSDEFMSLMRDPQIVEIVEGLIGGKASGLQSQFFFGAPGTKGYARHQDNFFVEAPYGSFVSVWMALVDVSTDNGGLTIWPGSHVYAKLPVRKLKTIQYENQDPNAANEETVLPIGFKPLDLFLGAGSMIFIHGSLVHASHTNETDRYRYAVLNTYVKKGSSFRRGYRAQREEVEL